MYQEKKSKDMILLQLKIKIKILIDGVLNDNVENEILDKIYNRELL